MSQADTIPSQADSDPLETAEWLECLRSVLESQGPQRVSFLLTELSEAAHREGVELPFTATTPYINTIPAEKQPPYPGNRELERRIKSIIRWNAMAMVTRANKAHDGIGGHISTFASAATLYEVAFNHFFHGKGDNDSGDQIYFQGHASPGMYARAFLEGRIDEKHLENFRQELADGGGLSSYPHPWLMPGFWEFPTVSMGLGPIMAIYQARFNKYLQDRGILQTNGHHVWAFLGDGETDEPESLGAITLAGRENLDNLIFVINCNLQRLDGPVRGNGKIIQELEGIFRGAGWNVIKVIWGDSWDPLLAKDQPRPAGQADGRSGRRRIPEVHRDARRVHSRALLRQVSGAGADGSRPVGRRFEEAAPRRARPGKSVRGVPGSRRDARPPDRDPGQDDQGLRHRRRRRGPQRHAPAEEAGRKRAARVPQPLWHSDFGRRGEQGAVLSAGRGQRGDSISQEAPPGAGRLRAAAPRQRRSAAKCRGSTTSRNSSKAAASAKCRPRWPSSASSPSCSRTRRSASTSCRSCPTNRALSAWKACSASAASTRTPDSSTSRSTPACSPTIAKPRTANCSKRASPKPARCRRSSPPAPPTPRTGST